MKGFKYQITVKVLLKNKSSMEKLNLLQFISIQWKKTVINHRFKLILFKKFYSWLMLGLIMDLAAML